MNEFKQYQRKGLSEMRPYVLEENMSGISVSKEDRKAGSPKPGDMIARNPKDHKDQWLVAEKYFNDNLQEVSQDEQQEESIEEEISLEKAMQIGYGLSDEYIEILGTGDFVISAVNEEKDVKQDDFETRLLNERVDLKERTGKLFKYLKVDRTSEIGGYQYETLKLQLKAMNTYLSCLDGRLDNLNIKH